MVTTLPSPQTSCSSTAHHDYVLLLVLLLIHLHVVVRLDLVRIVVLVVRVLTPIHIPTAVSTSARLLHQPLRGDQAPSTGTRPERCHRI